MKSETRLRNCSVLGVSEKSILILARLMICIATGNPDRQKMKARAKWGNGEKTGAAKLRAGIAHHVEDVSVGVGMRAEEIVLALHLIESCEDLAIAGVLFPQLRNPHLARSVAVVPVLHWKHEPVGVHVSRFRNDLAVALDRSHAGIASRPECDGFG